MGELWNPVGVRALSVPLSTLDEIQLVFGQMDNDAPRSFRQYLKDRDLRMTSDRLQIAMVTATFDMPFTADNVRDSLPTISRATIYRTLKMLVDAGLLDQVFSSNGAQVYSASSIVAEGMMPRRSIPAKQTLKYGQLCAASHHAVIVGTCPWCGAAIIPGNDPIDAAE